MLFAASSFNSKMQQKRELLFVPAVKPAFAKDLSPIFDMQGR